MIKIKMIFKNYCNTHSTVSAMRFGFLRTRFFNLKYEVAEF